MSLRDAYRQKFEGQIDEQKARLELLKAKAKQAAADGKIMTYEEIATAEEKIGALKVKLKELSSASEGAWEMMKEGIESAWFDLSESCKRAAGKFKE